MIVIAKIILLFAAFFPASAAAQSIEVTVDRTAIELNDHLRIEITVEGGQGEIELPDMPDFSIVSRSESTSISIINGAISQKKSITLLLQPLRTGALKIGEAKLVAGGRTVASSKPLTIRVTGGTSPRIREQPQLEPEIEPLPEPDPDIQREKKPPIFLNSSAPDRELFVGESFLLGYDLYIRSNVGVESLIVSQPKLDDFIVESVPVSAGQKIFRKQIEGVVYNVYPQFRAVIIPTRHGEFTIEGPVLELYTGGFFDTRRFRVAAEPVKIKVSKLPEAGKLPNFQEGNIGKFAISASLSKSTIKLGEKSVLMIETSGAGNFRNLSITGIPQIKNLSIDPIPSSDMDDLRVDEAGISGKRFFQYLLTPSAPGDIEIPPFRLDYFNPITKKYEATESEPLILRVLAAETVITAKKSHGEKDELAAIVWDLGKGVAESESSSLDKHIPLLFFIPALVILVAETTYRARQHRARNYLKIKSKKAFKTALRELATLKKATGMDVKAIYERLEDIVTKYMSDRFGINVRGDDLRQALAELSLDEAAVNNLLIEIESFSLVRFAPIGPHDVEIKGAFERVEKILREIEKSGKKRGPSGQAEKNLANGVPAALLLFTILSFAHCVALASRAPQQSGTNELFIEANRAYSEGDHEEALKTYRKLREDFKIESPALLFNMANALFKTGRIGEAIHHYKIVSKTSDDPELAKAATKNLEISRRTVRFLEEEKEGSVRYMTTEYHDGLTLVFTLIPVKTVLFIALFFFASFSTAFAFFRLRASASAALKFLTAAFFVMTLFSSAYLSGAVFVEENYNIGVVVEKETRLYDGKTLKATSQPVPEGLEVRILSEEGDFYHVELTGGQKGYLLRDAVEGI